MAEQPLASVDRQHLRGVFFGSDAESASAFSSAKHYNKRCNGDECSYDTATAMITVSPFIRQQGRWRGCWWYSECWMILMQELVFPGKCVFI